MEEAVRRPTCRTSRAPETRSPGERPPGDWVRDLVRDPRCEIDLGFCLAWLTLLLPPPSLFRLHTYTCRLISNKNVTHSAKAANDPFYADQRKGSWRHRLTPWCYRD